MGPPVTPSTPARRDPVMGGTTSTTETLEDLSQASGQQAPPCLGPPDVFCPMTSFPKCPWLGADFELETPSPIFLD